MKNDDTPGPHNSLGFDLSVTDQVPCLEEDWRFDPPVHDSDQYAKQADTRLTTPVRIESEHDHSAEDHVADPFGGYCWIDADTPSKANTEYVSSVEWDWTLTPAPVAQEATETSQEETPAPEGTQQPVDQPQAMEGGGETGDLVDPERAARIRSYTRDTIAETAKKWKDAGRSCEKGERKSVEYEDWAQVILDLTGKEVKTCSWGSYPVGIELDVAIKAFVSEETARAIQWEWVIEWVDLNPVVAPPVTAVKDPFVDWSWPPLPTPVVLAEEVPECKKTAHDAALAEEYDPFYGTSARAAESDQRVPEAVVDPQPVFKEAAESNARYWARIIYAEIGRLLTLQDEVSHLPGENPGRSINWRDYPTILDMAREGSRALPDALLKRKKRGLDDFLSLIKKDLRENSPLTYKEFTKLAKAGRIGRDQESGDWFAAVVASDEFRVLDKCPRRQLVLLDLAARIERMKATSPELLIKGFTHALSDCRVAVDPEQFRLIMKEDAVARLGWLKVKARVREGNLYVINNA